MKPGPVAVADLVERAGAGIERIAVRGDVQHAGIAREDVLRAVAVVDVPIDDQHPLEAVAGAQVGGTDGDVVEEAEAHGAIALGVVAGRADEREAVAHAARP